MSGCCALAAVRFAAAMSFDFAQDEGNWLLEISPHPERSRRIRSRYASQSPALQNQPRAGLLVEWPDRSRHPRIRDLAIAAAERSVAVDIDHLLGDRAQSRHRL